MNLDKLGLKFKIHSTGAQIIEKGQLKNEELLNFIENEDVYYTDKNYEAKAFRSLDILKGIDLEIADEKFFERWGRSIIFKIFAFNIIEFKKALVNKVNDMKDFGKIIFILMIKLI